MRVLALVMVCATVVAGCADSGSTAVDSDGFSDEVDSKLQATETTGVIRGVVVDASITPVVGANVTLQSTGETVVTNAEGAFGFAGLEPGAYFLEATKAGFNSTQTSVTVEAGVDRPPIVKILMDANPTTAPFIEDIFLRGFLACGAAVFYTSVGCTTLGFLAGATDSEAIWSLDFERLPGWAQGELVWEDTQPGMGAFIWQIVPSEYPGSPQPHIGYMETAPSPALAYLNETAIEENAEWILDKGVDYRFFGGPHELCPQHVGDPSVNRFGCGLVLEQEADVYIHHFYNFRPAEGWRFTSDGAHPIPES